MANTLRDTIKRGLCCDNSKAYGLCTYSAMHWPYCGAQGKDHATCPFRVKDDKEIEDGKGSRS
jgi:hypothetical protein